MMRTTRRILTAATLVAVAGLAAPAAAGCECGGPSYYEVESLSISVSDPVTGRGGPQVSVQVARIGDATGAGIAGASVVVRRVVNGVRMSSSGQTDARGAVVLRLAPSKASAKGWQARALASKETVPADGCAPGITETGQLSF